MASIRAGSRREKKLSGASDPRRAEASETKAGPERSIAARFFGRQPPEESNAVLLEHVPERQQGSGELGIVEETLDVLLGGAGLTLSPNL